ncbi:hypothetical protein DYB35_005093 [Aphanomyces astaci]|uniref:Kinesin motor domain-containing protein n=1 Tax=Aphanomyces astaci TaxID=112090 RepID=A0A3R7EIJ6_APHAT|nr:hypothetical protein DYB35_005093 [Aphanomyces astaci]
MISLSTTTKKGDGVKKQRSAEDDALKKLEANLGISKTNGRTKLNKKIEGSDHSESGDDSFDSGDDESGDDQDLQDEINMLATEDAGFLQGSGWRYNNSPDLWWRAGFDDLPTDDEDEVDDLAQYESDDEDMSDDEDVARNTKSIAMEFESIYRAHVRADVNRVLLETLLATCCHETQVMTQLITVNAALLGALFHSIGTEIVGFFVENFVQLFHKKLEALHQTRLATSDDDTPSKETSNLLLFITNLYGFETVHCTLVYDIFRYLSDRKNQTHMARRVQFLLDLISNLKKQKAKSKGTSALSSDRFLHLRKWIGRVKTRVGHANNPLRVSLSELLAADEAKYNPFYALLGSKFAQSDTRYKFTLQLAFWDIFKQVLDFTELSPSAVLFLKVVFEKLLLIEDESTVLVVFERIALQKVKTPALRDGITVFLHQHMLPYKFKDSKGKSRAKMRIGAMPTLLTIKSHVELQNATGETVQKRPLRKHKHALGTSLACLQDQVLGVHDPEIQEIRRTGLGDFTHEFLLCDVDGDWVVLESDDIVQARGFLQIKVLLRLNIIFPRGDELFVSRHQHLAPLHVDLVKCGPTTTTNGDERSIEDAVLTQNFDSFSDSDMTTTVPFSSQELSHLGAEGPSTATDDTCPSMLDDIALRCRRFTHCDFDCDRGRFYWVDQLHGDLGYIDEDSDECCVLVQRLQRPSHVKLLARTLAFYIEQGRDSNGGSISCVNLETREVSVVVTGLTNPTGLCIVLHPTTLVFGQTTVDHVLTISAMPYDTSPPTKDARTDATIKLLVTKAFTASVQPTAISIASDGSLCVGFASIALPPSRGQLSLWIPSTKYITSTPGLYDYNLATAVDMAMPHSVRDVMCHPSRAFFMFCMADPDTMTHSSALGTVHLDSVPPQLQLDPERFVQTTCLAGTHDRVYYCASVGAMDTIVYTFLHVERGGRREVDDVEPARGTPLLVFTQPIGACLDTTSDLRTVEKHGRLDGPVNIQVILRSRPLLRHEIDRGVQSVVTCSGCNALHVAPIRSYQASKHFTFDRVYGPASTQDDLYQTSILPLVHRVLQGYKCTVLAYGQTGSGKTHSMEGSAGDRGMIFKSIATIFDQLKGKADCRVRMSHVEIYNEELTDLLSTSQRDERKASHVDKFFVHRVKKAHPGIRGLSKMKRSDELDDFEDKVDLPKLSIIRHPCHGVIVQGLEEVSIQSAADAQTLLERSFYLMDGSGDQSISYGQLRLVDLSGSENYDRAGAQRDRQLEAANIGQGLLALGRVIRALVEKWPHVPYRESKLTRLLEDSLGGTSMTTLLLAVSPGDEAHEETLNTLNYATLAKRVTTRPRKSTIFHTFDSKKGGALCKHDAQKVYHELFHLPKAAAPPQLLLDDFLATFDALVATNPMLARHIFTSQGYTLNMEKTTPKQSTASTPIKSSASSLTSLDVYTSSPTSTCYLTASYSRSYLAIGLSDEPNILVQEIRVPVGNFRGLRDVRMKKSMAATRPSSAPVHRDMILTQSSNYPQQCTERSLTR